ncbi:MAG: SemiSWEET transporter [Pseudomonadota bacterium]
MGVVELVGFGAAALTTVAFVPQAILTWKQRRAEGVSLSMYLVFVLGVACWLTSGVLIGSAPIIVANVVTLALSGFILAMKLRHG